jgi:hypothetical protein
MWGRGPSQRKNNLKKKKKKNETASFPESVNKDCIHLYLIALILVPFYFFSNFSLLEHSSQLSVISYI